MSNPSSFDFLEAEWASLYDACRRSEATVYSDARASCFYARRSLEIAVAWLYKYDSSLKLPYQDNLSALIHEPTFKTAAGEIIFTKARLITKLGNQAVHGDKPVQQIDSLTAVRELFHVCYWLARTYGRQSRPEPGLSFDPRKLPTTSAIPKQTAEQLQRLEISLREKDEHLSSVLADKAALDKELEQLRASIAAAKASAHQTPDNHDYSEEATRDYFIDLLLKEAGWALDQERDREFEVIGMPNKEGIGFVDYVLWGNDGIPLALVEAKRTRRDSRVGQQQAKLYADCIEQQFGRRPVIFYSNGYEHWIWDDANYPPREVQGFYKRAELELLVQRRGTKKPLATADISTTIIERYYQSRAIRHVAESFEKGHERKALLVMATGAGKTRTVIALADLLMRCNWAKRVLFLADRVALVNQAANAFKAFLPDAAPVNLVTEKDVEGRVYVSTYPTMMGLIDETRDGQRRFGVGHFDLIIIDEAHRSVFQKYRAIFQYFDSFLVGLTATPKDEVEKNTYSLFDLEDGVPTDAYSLDEAVRDGFLVPAKAVSVPLKFQREGIRYEDLSDEERDQWDELEWNEEGETPDQVDPESVNKWLFNKDTVDKVLEHLMTNGIKVAGGDRLGKTIVFAKNNDHAEFIAKRFNDNYPHYKGKFARVITFKTEYAQSLIDDFSQREKMPHIAVSVDMLDTGIDVPEVVNLVFFKVVRSKTKFWQMVGRGTRLCKGLFGPDQDKQFFFVFDYCQNLEFFSQDIEAADGAVGESLSKRLFKRRLELIAELDNVLEATAGDGAKDCMALGKPDTEAGLRRALATHLQCEVTAMNLDNFVVRPHRKLVEQYGKPDAWVHLSPDALSSLGAELAGLPTELDPESEEAKRFDLLLLNLQLARMKAELGFVRLRDQLRVIAGLLEEKSSIPMVKDHLVLIQDLQTESWWQDVTVPMLEQVRRKLRDLIRLIDKKQRKPVFTDFEDELGASADVPLPGFHTGDDFERFRAKARAFLRAHEDHVAVRKLRMNKALTASDISELERMLEESGAGSAEDIERAKNDSHGLGLFVREMVGLDRGAAKEALASFMEGKKLSSNQIEFLNLIIDHLTEHGVMEPERLYESPFTDVAPTGPDSLFGAAQMSDLVFALEQVRVLALVSNG